MRLGKAPHPHRGPRTAASIRQGTLHPSSPQLSICILAEELCTRSPEPVRGRGQDKVAHLLLSLLDARWALTGPRELATGIM